MSFLSSSSVSGLTPNFSCRTMATLRSLETMGIDGPVIISPSIHWTNDGAARYSTLTSLCSLELFLKSVAKNLVIFHLGRVEDARFLLYSAPPLSRRCIVAIRLSRRYLIDRPRRRYGTNPRFRRSIMPRFVK